MMVDSPGPKLPTPIQPIDPPVRNWWCGWFCPFITIVLVVVVWVFWINQPLTVVLIRHAEKAQAPPADPPLSAAGEARAEELIDVLGDAGVDAIFTSQLIRTIETGQPLQDHLGVPRTEVTIDENNPAPYVADVVSLLRSGHWGEVVLVVSHSVTVPIISAALGAPATGDIGDEFDNLFVITVPRFWGTAPIARVHSEVPN